MLKTVSIGKKINGVIQSEQFMVMGGDRIILIDAATGMPPKKIMTKMINNNLHIFEEGSTEPSVILNDYETFKDSVYISGIDGSGAYIDYNATGPGVMELGAAAVQASATEGATMPGWAIAGLGVLAIGGIAAAANSGGDGESVGADTTAPTATITLDNSVLNTSETATVTIVFSEAVKDFSLSDLSAENGTLSNLSTTDNITWTATLTPTAATADATNAVTLADTYTDNAGNAGTAAISPNYEVDTTVASPSPSAAITLSDTLLNSGESAVVTIVFSEAVVGFGTEDVTVQNGTLSTFTSSDNITWTATFTPTAGIADASNVITLAGGSYTDTDSNAGQSATSPNYQIDTTVAFFPLTVTITDDEDMLTANMDGSNADNTVDANGADILYTFTFNRAVKNFTIDDITVYMQQTDGTVDSTYTAATDPEGSVFRTFTKISDSVYTLGVRPEAGYEGVMKISLDSSDATDVSGNAIDTSNLSALSSLQAVDMLAPTYVAGSMAVHAGDESIVLTYSEILEAVNMSNPDSFIVKMIDSNGTLDVNDDIVSFNAVTSVGMFGNEVTLIMTDAFEINPNISFGVTYADTTGDATPAIQDLAGNDATSLAWQYATAVL